MDAAEKIKKTIKQSDSEAFWEIFNRMTSRFDKNRAMTTVNDEGSDEFILSVLKNPMASSYFSFFCEHGDLILEALLENSETVSWANIHALLLTSRSKQYAKTLTDRLFGVCSPKDKPEFFEHLCLRGDVEALTLILSKHKDAKDTLLSLVSDFTENRLLKKGTPKEEIYDLINEKTIPWAAKNHPGILSLFHSYGAYPKALDEAVFNDWASKGSMTNSIQIPLLSFSFYPDTGKIMTLIRNEKSDVLDALLPQCTKDEQHMILSSGLVEKTPNGKIFLKAKKDVLALEAVTKQKTPTKKQKTPRFL